MTCRLVSFSASLQVSSLSLPLLHPVPTPGHAQVFICMQMSIDLYVVDTWGRRVCAGAGLFLSGHVSISPSLSLSFHGLFSTCRKVCSGTSAEVQDARQRESQEKRKLVTSHPHINLPHVPLYVHLYTGARRTYTRIYLSTYLSASLSLSIFLLAIYLVVCFYLSIYLALFLSRLRFSVYSGDVS